MVVVVDVLLLLEAADADGLDSWMLIVGLWFSFLFGFVDLRVSLPFFAIFLNPFVIDPWLRGRPRNISKKMVEIQDDRRRKSVSNTTKLLSIVENLCVSHVNSLHKHAHQQQQEEKGSKGSNRHTFLLR